jgi:hypothetical protein
MPLIVAVKEHAGPAKADSDHSVSRWVVGVTFGTPVPVVSSHRKAFESTEAHHLRTTVLMQVCFDKRASPDLALFFVRNACISDQFPCGMILLKA